MLAAIQEFARVLATDPPAATVANSGGSVYFDLWGRSMVRGWVGLLLGVYGALSVQVLWATEVWSIVRAMLCVVGR